MVLFFGMLVTNSQCIAREDLQKNFSSFPSQHPLRSSRSLSCPLSFTSSLQPRRQNLNLSFLCDLLTFDTNKLISLLKFYIPLRTTRSVITFLIPPTLSHFLDTAPIICAANNDPPFTSTIKPLFHDIFCKYLVHSKIFFFCSYRSLNVTLYKSVLSPNCIQLYLK